MKKYLKNLSLISSVILRKLRLRQKKWFSYEKTCASRNWAFFQVFSMVSSLLVQLKIFLQFYLIELRRLLTVLGLLEL